MKDDGGPAMPPTEEMQFAFPGREFETRQWWGGLTMRDWFAGQVVTGLICQSRPPAIEQKNMDDYAAWAYEMANAMLAARKETP